MSTSPESELDLDLHFLPAWAQQSAEVNRYAKYEGGEDIRPSRRGDRPDRREGRDRRDRRSQGGDRWARRPEAGRDQNKAPGPRPAQASREDRQPRRFGEYRREEGREPSQPLPQLNVTLVPEEKGVESLARQIKLTGRAYPLFEIAQLILKKPERYHVVFSVMKNDAGQIAQALWVCNLDETVWLSEQDAISHVLKRHFDTFYQTERTPTEAPKGTYTFVAQCGMSNVILGPPNYHDYQNKLRKLHAERFFRIPFEVYKSRVRIVRDEAIVKQWLEDQSSKTEYVCLNVTEAKKLASREELEQHFRETHLPNIIKSVESFRVTTPASRQVLPAALGALSREAWEEQRRFPLRMATNLSQQFASHGLQFFKVNKTVTHVAVARPHYLEVNTTPVSDGIRRIVDFINATPKCTRRRLLDALAPSPGEATSDPPDPKAAEPDAATPTPEMRAVSSDLHWLVHQGHVIEFANGILETAKQPAPRPMKPAPAPIRQPGSETESSDSKQTSSSQTEGESSVPAEATLSSTSLNAITEELVPSPLAERSAEIPPSSPEPVNESHEQAAPRTEETPAS